MTTVRERVLEALLETAIDYAIIALDLDGVITSWSEGAHVILGWTAGEMIGRPASVFFTEEDRARGIPQAEMEAAVAHGRGNDERWHLRRDGTRFWANGEMMPLRDTDGRLHGLIKILRDRTAQRMAEERQRADAEFLRSMLASSGDCLKVLDLDGSVLFVNEGGVRALGAGDASQVRGRSWPALWEGAGRADAVAALAAAKAGGTGNFQGMAATFAGALRCWDVQVTPMLDAAGRPEKLLVVSRDITATRAAEIALREAQGLNTLILESSRDCIVVLDLAGRTQFVNPGGVAAMEIDDVSAIIGTSWLHVWDSDQAALAQSAVAEARAGGIGRFQGCCATHKGTLKWWDVVISPLPGADGRPAQLVCVGRDITEAREAQQRLQLLMEELSHRVKNNLSVVQSIAVQTLRGEGSIEAARDAFTARLMALSTAHDILLQGSWTCAGLRTLVESAASLYAPQTLQGARLLADGPEVTLGPGAALAFAMVLHELGTNAVKYGALSTPAGHVTVAWSVADGTLHFSWSEHGGPPVSPPGHRGFGSRLIARSLAAELRAVVAHEFPARGVVLRLDAPLAGLVG